MNKFFKVTRKNSRGVISVFYININSISFISVPGSYITINEYGDFDLYQNELKELIKLIEN